MRWSDTEGSHVQRRGTNLTAPILPARAKGHRAERLQEIQAKAPFSPGINEAVSTVTGTYQGTRTTGQAYVEQLGIWK
jgi:hypothetical protein